MSGQSGSPGRPTPGPARLVEANLIDRAFYEAVTGLSFEHDRAAARHFLREAGGTLAPHPLIDPLRLPDWVRNALAHGQPGPLLRYLRSRGSQQRLNALFDGTALGATDQQRSEHPGGALGLFLETADDDTVLPGREDLTLGQARATLLDRVRLIHEQARHSGPRVVDSWDADAEERWRARWRSAPLPRPVEGPLVSVVIPVRNRADQVGAAIESVLAQTMEAWELIVVDDGSTDDTVAVLQRWAESDPRIRVVTQEWAGVSTARNRGLEHARGRYLAFLDSDNRWRPDFLGLAIAAMHGEGLQAAYAGMVLHEDGRVRYRAHPFSFDDLLVQNFVDPNVLVVERDLAEQIGGFDAGLRRWVDYDFALRLARRTELRLLPFLAVDYDASQRTDDRITTSQSPSYQFVVLGRQWVDWDAVRAGVPDRVPGRLSVVVTTHDDAETTTRCVRSVLRNTPQTDVEVVIVDNGSTPQVGLSLAAEFVGEERVQYLRLPRDLRLSVGSNVGFARSSGEYVAFLSHRAVVRPGWWPPVAADLADRSVLGVQPLLLRPDETILSAGTVFPVSAALPCPYLEGHPAEDAFKVQDRRLHAISATAMIARAATLAELSGFDPLLVDDLHDLDLALRAAAALEGHFLLEPDARVNVEPAADPEHTFDVENRRHLWARWRGRLPGAERHRWAEAGFSIVHHDADDLPFPSARPVVVRSPSATDGSASDAVLRWGIATSAGGGEGGDSWGDLHFAGSLAAALRSLDQDVVTHRRGAHGASARFDDVRLALRGFFRVDPVPGKINVLWVISHPTDVTPDELDGYDLVYAASASWAEKMSRLSGRTVGVLLQATDLRLRDVTAPLGTAATPVFVGNTNPTRPRQVVLDAVAAGVPLEVHGKGWAGTAAEPWWRSPYVPNHELMTLYRSHGLVLADHWPDMAQEGFLANRLFDAVASGARVVSDPVPGVEEFGGAVQTYSSVDELGLLCGPEGRDRFPGPEEMVGIADRIAAEHSFDRRATDLLDAVRGVAAGRRS